MNFLKQYKGQLLFTLILFLAILVMPFQDYAERTFLMDEISYPEEYKEVLLADNGILTVPEGLDPVILNTGSLYLKKGSYDITFNMVSYEEGSLAEIYDPNYVNPDNTVGRVLASAEIPANGENVTLHFNIDTYRQCFQLRVHANKALEYHSIYLLSEPGIYKDTIIYACLFAAASALLLLYRTRRKVSMENLLLLGFAAVFSSLPLCYTWLLGGHDLYFHYGRLFTLGEDLSRGLFPVRFHSSMYRGMGYISPVFYSEFFLYPFALLGVLGMSPIGCYKLLVISINFATALVASYSFSRLLRSRKIGTIAAFLYTLSMYRIINLYTRAAIGELLATVFLPLLLLGMYQLFIGDSRKWPIATLAFTALLQSHLITTELAVGFGCLFALCFIRNLKDKKRILHLGLAAGFTVLLNLWFLVPMLDHMQYSIYAFHDVRNLSGYAPFPIQLFDVGVNNPTAMAEGPNTILPEMPYSVGIVLLIGILLFLFTSDKKERMGKLYTMGCYSLFFGGLALYASSTLFPWDAIQRVELFNRIIGGIQFSSRFLPIATVFFCLVAALGIYYFFQEKEQKKMLFLISAIVTFYSIGGYYSNYTEQAQAFVTKATQMDHTLDTDPMYLIDNDGEYFSLRRMGIKDTSFDASEGILLFDCYREGTDAGFTYTKTVEGDSSYVDVSFNYYPYFHAYDSEGNRLETSLNELLRLRIFLPDKGSDTITVHYEMPALYQVMDGVSLISALIFVSLLFLSKRRALTSSVKEQL